VQEPNGFVSADRKPTTVPPVARIGMIPYLVLLLQGPSIDLLATRMAAQPSVFADASFYEQVLETLFPRVPRGITLRYAFCGPRELQVAVQETTADAR